MTDEEAGTNYQINVADSQRNAQRDYIEVLAPQSMKLYLVMAPQAHIDEQTLGNSGLFRHRFGFEAARHEVRAQVLAIQKRLEITDREMRWQRYSGQLQVTRTSATLKPDRMMPVLGWVQLSLFSLIFVAWVFQIGLSGTPAWKQILGQFAVAVVWSGVASVLLKLYIEPWNLLRKVGAR